jgi:clan AA aspartic protease
MITGVVNARREATIRLPVRDASGQEQEIEVVLDTGFSGSLTLPPSVIVVLGLPFRSRGSALLADGSETEFDIHAATIIWDGAARNILVEAADTDPLVGMGLLYGHDIHIRAVDGGPVTIQHLTN